jgi:hypothetical protein
VRSIQSREKETTEDSIRLAKKRPYSRTQIAARERVIKQVVIIIINMVYIEHDRYLQA